MTDDGGGTKVTSGTVVYRPNMRSSIGILETYATMVRNAIRSKDLIWQLFKRDFFAGYRKSLLGYAWLIIGPLMGVMSWILMNSAGILSPGATDVPYPVYILIGSSMWGLFMGFYGAAAGTLSAGSGLILQVNYPHEVLLLKQLAQNLATFMISLLINLVIICFFGVVPSWKVIFLPLVVLPMLFLASALGLFVAMLAVVAVDVGNMMQFGLGFLVYLIPVMYSDHVSKPLLAKAIAWNPLTYIVCSARDIVLHGKLYGPKGYAVSFILSFLAFLLSLRTFYVLEHRLVERIT